MADFLQHRLPKLKALTYLHQIHSLEPLQPLASLTFLSFRLNGISELTPLEALTSLKKLELLGTNPSGLDELPGLDRLQSLASLRSLHIAPLGSSDCLWLEACTQIEEVVLNSAYLSELPVGVLRMCCNLQKLAFGAGNFWDYRISGLVSLRALMLEGDSADPEGSGESRDLSPLSSLTALHTLIIEDLKVDALENLQFLTQLTCLGMQSSHPLWQGYEHHGAEWLSNLVSLQRLDLESTRMRDANVGVLSKLTTLRILNLGHNKKVKHVAALASLSQLQWLGLCDCKQMADGASLPPRVLVSRDEADFNWFAEA